jgi:hypothetical protein
MGTAPVQGPLWGTHASHWADLQEPTILPAYEVVLEKLKVGPDIHLLRCRVWRGTGSTACRAARRSGGRP